MKRWLEAARHSAWVSAVVGLAGRVCGGALVLSAALAVACSNSPAGNDAGASGLPFASCPLLTQPFTAPPTGTLVGGHGFDGRFSATAQWIAFGNEIDDMSSATAECATTKLPAVWSDPHGDSIDVFVKRYPAAVQPAKGQLWLLSGGPGQAGSVFEAMAFLVAKSIPTLDIYLPDHRGTGKSTFAPCPPGSSTPSDCAAAIPHLDGITTTDAARDLAALIDASHTSSQPVFVYGISYGTRWAQRYLQLRPDQPTAVILDSTEPAEMDYALFDKNFDDGARAVLALCQADAACSAKLGTDPLARAEQARSLVGAGTCQLPAGLGQIRGYFGRLVSTGYFEPLLLPASIYRVLRCSDADRTWLGKVRAFLAWRDTLLTAGWSEVVARNIVLSELWPTSPTPAALLTQEETMLAIDGGPVWFALATSWPKYPHDAYYGKWPSSPAPILVLQGTLDPRTPYGDVVKPHYSGKSQYYVELPRAAHAVGWPLNSPMADLSAPGCGWQIVQSFLADPTKPPDTSCIAGMAPLDFGSPPPEWLAHVGIQDLWENP